jgi:DNA-binding HxlR family transcriptional regulator
MALGKVTDSRNGPSRRRYDDACGTAHALDLIGERWALLVMRELMLGPKRFSDIRADLPGISANTLTQRLEGLEANGLVVRRRLPPPASAQVYELTIWGYEAEPIVQTLGRWATRSPGHDPTMPLSATSLMLSFRTMGDRTRMKGLKARIGFRLGAETFLVTIADGRLRAERRSRRWKRTARSRLRETGRWRSGSSPCFRCRRKRTCPAAPRLRDSGGAWSR